MRFPKRVWISVAQLINSSLGQPHQHSTHYTGYSIDIWVKVMIGVNTLFVLPDVSHFCWCPTGISWPDSSHAKWAVFWFNCTQIMLIPVCVCAAVKCASSAQHSKFFSMPCFRWPCVLNLDFQCRYAVHLHCPYVKIKCMWVECDKSLQSSVESWLLNTTVNQGMDWAFMWCECISTLLIPLSCKI